MIDFLPLFPLKLVVFPGEEVKLHIFEPRYKQLLRECEQNGTTFGIPAFLDDKVKEVGTEIKLLSVKKRYENGELDIITKGIGVFKINKFYQVTPNKLYAGADIERIKDIENGKPSLNEAILRNIKKLFKILKINQKVPPDAEAFNTWSVGHNVGFSLEQEYEFLSIKTEYERQEYMLAHLERLIPIVKEMERLRQKAKMNGHFKNVIPPKMPPSAGRK